jgi:hypothetical protein
MKVLLNSSSTTTTSITRYFDGGKSYYMELVCSVNRDTLLVFINAKMYNTSLTESYSNQVLNENQEIEISSTLTAEEYVNF